MLKPNGMSIVSKASPAGFQQITFGKDGWVKVAAGGAKGGYSYATRRQGGNGAKISGTFAVKKGQVLTVAVGQSGWSRSDNQPDNGGSYGGGGGGGTFVWDENDNNTLWVAAGGGGGTSYSGGDSLQYYGDVGRATTSAGGACPSGGAGGSGGKGGDSTQSSDGRGGGGGGWLAKGNCGSYYAHACGGSFDENFVGGQQMYTGYNEGGFGGGAGTRYQGGGGGGYSGGGGGQHGDGSGGGGGSYIAGGMLTSSLSGGNTEIDGWASFSWVEPPAAQSDKSMLLNTCGQKGRYGPRLSDCVASETSEAGKKFKFDVTSSGVQEITVPDAGYYIVSAHGAMGGSATNNGGRCDRTGVASNSYRGGNGAFAYGVFKFNAGDKLSALVGQRPGDCTSDNCGGGGGGGSFVWQTPTTAGEKKVLVAAGGGGGASYASTDPSYWGHDGAATADGTLCKRGQTYSGAAGVNGLGGASHESNSVNNGGGGGGWNGNGECKYYGHTCGLGGPGYFEGGKYPPPLPPHPRLQPYPHPSTQTATAATTYPCPALPTKRPVSARLLSSALGKGTSKATQQCHLCWRSLVLVLFVLTCPRRVWGIAYSKATKDPMRTQPVALAVVVVAACKVAVVAALLAAVVVSIPIAAAAVVDRCRVGWSTVSLAVSTAVKAGSVFRR